MLGSFLFFLALFVGVGALAVFKAKHNTKDYLLAGRAVSPWLAGLSAVATNNSGYMFIGQIGFTYTYGWSSVWLMFGWLLGDFLISFVVHPKLRAAADREHFLSFGAVLSRWQGEEFRRARILVGLLTFIFLCAYTAAQFKAGSKALHVLFGWDYSIGAIIGTLIVIIYCFAGGLRASIWTDAAQSIVMLFSMGLLLAVAIESQGGLGETLTRLYAVSPDYMSWSPVDLAGGALVLWITGWLFAGAGVIGMPHVMVRFLALDSKQSLWKVRIYYYSWYFIFYCLCIGVGLCARLLIPEISAFDAELALPRLAQQLLPSVLVGLVLAGLFAGTMSTADSLVLSCSSAITRDIFIARESSYLFTKLATLFAAVVSLFIALYGNDSVFLLVLFAWSALASAFGPILILYAFGVFIAEKTVIAMLIISPLVAVAWQQCGLSDYIYEIAPGMGAGFLVYLGGQFFGWNKRPASSLDSGEK